MAEDSGLASIHLAIPRRIFDIENAETATLGTTAYQLLTAIVVPRPIPWVSTVSADGVGNLAPHSFFTVSCTNPAIVQFTSVGRKDTLRNIEQTGEFTISLAPEHLLDQVNNSSAPYDADVAKGRPRRPAVLVKHLCSIFNRVFGQIGFLLALLTVRAILDR